MNRSRSSMMSQPVLIGSATALVAGIACVLAFNANTGLPFVETYDISADVQNARQLGTGNDVRIGGKRIGQVTAIEPVARPGRRPFARIALQLDRSVAQLPSDTVLRIRLRGVIGSKFVELVPGSSPRTLPAGAVIPERNTSASVDLQDIANTFEVHSRSAVRGIVRSTSDAVAGRGSQINDAIGELPRTLRLAAPVLQNLADPRTDLTGFVGGLDVLTAAVLPVSSVFGQTFGPLSRTLAAVERRGPDLDGTLRRAPGTVEELGRASTRLRPVLDDAQRVVRDLRPAAERSRMTLRGLSSTLRAGVAPLRRTPALARRADRLLGSLDAVSVHDETAPALQLLRPAGDALVPLLGYLTPVQTRCNGVGLFFDGTVGITAGGDRYGNWYELLPVLPLPLDTRVAKPGPDVHMQTYSDPSRTGTCPIGNERYEPGRQTGTSPGPAPSSNPNTPWTGTP